MAKANVPKDGKLIAQNGDWQLFERFRYRDWRNFKLLDMSEEGKSNYWFGFGEGRFNLSKDVGLLKKYNPEAYNWVVQIINETAP